MTEKNGKGPAIVLDLNLKRALEARAQQDNRHQVILPWWFKRECSVKRSHEATKAFAWLMRWLYHNAPEEAENVYCEADDSQNIVINPMVIINPEVLDAFKEAGFRLCTEEDMPTQEKTDWWERVKAGSNFSNEWH